MTKRQKITGRQITDAIIDLAETLGYRCVHFRPARTKRGWTTAMQGRHSKGWPDLVLVGNRVIVIEVKGDGDTLRPEQAEWLDAFRHAGVEAHLITAQDWLDGAVDLILGAPVRNAA